MSKYTLILILSLATCTVNVEQSIDQKLIGVWVNKFNENHTIEFTDDGYFYKIIDDNDFLASTFFVENADGMLEERNYGKMYYKIQPLKNDSIRYRLVGSENGLEFSRGIFVLKGNTLIEITHKTLPTITNHIDELAVYQKKGTTTNSSYKTTEKIIVPRGFKDRIYIAYDQAEGQELVLDSMGNRIIQVSENGLAKVKFKENPLILVEQRFEFYEQDTLTGALSRMREFQHGDYRELVTKLKKQAKQVNLKYNIDSTAMFVYGFNQAGRNYINREVFQDTIDGNIVMFEVDTIYKKLKLNQYFDKVKN